MSDVAEAGPREQVGRGGVMCELVGRRPATCQSGLLCIRETVGPMWHVPRARGTVGVRDRFGFLDLWIDALAFRVFGFLGGFGVFHSGPFGSTGAF